MNTLLVKFDAFLHRFNCDQTAWADGGGAEEAREMLAELSPNEWSQLNSLCSSRGTAWRACLASILHPRQGKGAEQLMLDLACDQDAEVSFLAVSGIAFHCGVNDSAEGPFTDLEIQDPSFLQLARVGAGLVDQIHRVRASCAPHFQRRLDLLVKLLQPGA
jgi:hypothetical protein